MSLFNKIIDNYDLPDLFKAKDYLNPNDFIDEARQNAVSIYFEQEDAAKYSVNDLTPIIEKIINSKNEFAIRSKKYVIFYL